MAARKPKDLRDILNAVAGLTGNKPSRQSTSAMSSAAVASINKAKKQTIKKTSDTGHKIAKATTGAAKYALGDPKKGWKDVAYNTGTWILPYGKAFKVVNAGVKGAKYYKSAKAVRGAIKGATLIGAPAALDKALKAIPSGKKQGSAVPNKMKGK